MVWPILLSGASLLSLAAMARAATSIAGLSRKLPASCREASSDRTSRSSASSPAQARRKNSARSSGGRSNAACSSLSTCFHCSESIACPAGQFAIKPRFGGAPIAHHRDRRYLEHLRRLFHAESAKEAHFDDLHFAWIEPRQRVHRVIERHQVRGPVAAYRGRLFQRHMLHAAPAFQVVATRMFHQNAPHQLR